ncbi:MAG: hypothetical protein J2P37_32790, partial [Ktedonobacteraceae bacterium]|nr:hypothetical protein [Ktedonobacteraceae bacterium]
MKSSFDIEVGGAGDIWGYLLYRALPIALAGILMLWLSGGGSIVPNILVQLFYIFTHLNVLMASKGEDTIISLVVLIIQAIILAVVWVFYIRIVIRTIVDLREIVSQVEHSQAMALAALSNEQIAVQKLEEQARRAQTSQHMAAAPAWRAPSAPANPPARGQQVYEAQDLNPFNADEEGSFLLDQPSAPRPAVTRRPTVQQTPPSPVPERPAAQQP